MIIRKETTSDIEAISQVTTAAFRTLPISNHTEQFIIEALRTAGALHIARERTADQIRHPGSVYAA